MPQNRMQASHLVHVEACLACIYPMYLNLMHKRHRSSSTQGLNKIILKAVILLFLNTVTKKCSLQQVRIENSPRQWPFFVCSLMLYKRVPNLFSNTI